MKGRIRAGLVGFAATFALAVSPALAATETFGSSQTRAPDTSGPCGQQNCVVFQSEPSSGGTNTPTAAGQVTEISIKKSAGALNIQPVVISGPLTGASSYTLESIGDTITLNAAESTQAYPLATPLAIDPGDTVGIRYPDGPPPVDPDLFNFDASPRISPRANGGSITRIGNTTAGPGPYPPSVVLANYDLLSKVTITRDDPPGEPYDLKAGALAKPHQFTVKRDKDGELFFFSETWAIPFVYGYVENSGPAESDPAVSRTTVVGFGNEADTVPKTDNCSSPAPDVIDCQIPSLDAGASASATTVVRVLNQDAFLARLPFQIGYSVSVTCNSLRETTCDNNVAVASISYVAPPSSDWERQTSKLLAGTADGPASARRRGASGRGSIDQVEVAALKLEKGLRGFSGELQPTNPIPVAAKAKQCLWLKNKKAKFSRSDPNGKTCDDPVWLKTKGREKWSYKLKQPLPPGNYVAYARATTNQGGVEFFFAKSEKNRIEFKLD